MKKNVLLVLVALLAIVVAGCGGDTSSNKEKKAEVSKIQDTLQATIQREK